MNDFLGIVEDISSTDLLEHNDVFDDSNSEDSFNIEFQSENITDAEELEESNEKGDSQIKDLSIADDIFSQRNGITYNDTSTETSFSKYSNTGKKFFRSRMSTKLVGMSSASFSAFCLKFDQCLHNSNSQLITFMGLGSGTAGFMYHPTRLVFQLQLSGASSNSIEKQLLRPLLGLNL